MAATNTKPATGKPRGKAAAIAKVAPVKPMTAIDKGALAWMLERVNRRIVPSYEADPARPGHVRSVERDSIRHHNRLCQALGTASFTFVHEIVHKLMNPPGGTAESAVSDVNAGLEFIASFNPRDEGETTLLLGAWFSHLASANLLRRTLRADNIEHLNVYGALAGKYASLHVRQLEAFAKLRGGGKQEVVVTHVHQHVYVGNGGQAVVGNVSAGGGGDREILTRPPLPISHAIVPPMWREDAGRDAMPVPSGEGTPEMPSSRVREGIGGTEG